MVRRIRDARLLVIGCGNVLFGDDGFGPAVMERLKTEHPLPDWVVAVDAGTAAGDILLDALLGDETPEVLIVVDAMDFGLEPGTVREIPLEALPPIKRDDFSVHQLPGMDILGELTRRRGVTLRILGCQVESLPPEIRPGLSDAVERGVTETARLILEMVRKEAIA